MTSSRKTPTLCERDTRQLWGTNLIHPLARDVKNTLENEEMVDIILLCDKPTTTLLNKLLLSESAVSCLLCVRSVFFTSRAKGCIKFVPHSCLVSLSHKVGVVKVYFKWGWNKSPFDINSVVFHFDDSNYGRRSQPYCFW
jgi:hypothetical protein